jgi:hypothetical protein
VGAESRRGEGGGARAVSYRGRQCAALGVARASVPRQRSAASERPACVRVSIELESLGGSGPSARFISQARGSDDRG